MYRASVNDEFHLTLEVHDKGFMVNNQLHSPEITKVDHNTYLVILQNKPYTVTIDSRDKNSRNFKLYINSRPYAVKLQHASEGKILDVNRADSIRLVEILRAPMPGIIAEVFVKNGDIVIDGQPLLVLKAMKMENIIRASHDAIVNNVAVTVNQIITKDEALIHF